MRRLLAEGAVRSPGDCAVLYRTNAQARELELACLEAGLPYSVRGNSDFLARKEIRDLFAYLRLVHNPQDVAALGRVVNTPPRRLAALERRIRGGEELTLARLEEEFPCGLKGDAAASSGRVPGAGADSHGHGRRAAGTAHRGGAGDHRLPDLAAAPGGRREAAGQPGGVPRPRRALGGRGPSEFLDEMSLATDLDTGSDPEGLALSTIHAAKGLEWPVVFVAGLEEGLLPHARALDGLEGEGSPLEEELRLCYVAATRAVDRLYLTYARRRPGHGRAFSSAPSRFLRGIPDDLVERRAA